ncbi:MAG TPA: TonB-dependent receptor [Caulobacteraceae bacterium]
MNCKLLGGSFTLAGLCAVLCNGTVRAETAAQAASPSSSVSEIIVTAQRRAKSVQTIPETVAAVSGEVLAQEHVKDLFQAVTLAPGVIFSRAPDDGLALTFRGLGTQARPQAFDQSVALFVDGVFIGKGRLYSTSFFDVDRMEFIKGAQSTLLGKNASLGAISVISRQPGDTYSAEASAGYEFEDGGYMLDAAGDLPLGPNVSMRLAAHYNDLNGWVHNDRTGHDGPEHEDLGLRAILRADLTKQLRITALYQYADNRQIGASYQLVGPIPAAYGDGVLDDHTSQFTLATSSGETEHATRSHLASVVGEMQLGKFQLISQTSYVRYDLNNLDDFDFSIDNAVNFGRREKYDQVSEELRLQSPSGGRFDYMAGLFILSSHWNSQEAQMWGVPGFPPAGGPPPGQLFNGPFVNHFVQDSRDYSGFASGSWHISSRLKLSGGVRYSDETKSVVFSRSNSAPITVWNTIANPPFDPTNLSHEGRLWDGNVSLQYDLSPSVMVYGSFGHGSKSGGFVETNTIAVDPSLLVAGKVPPALVAAGSAIKDEYTRTYEIGLKSSLLDRRLRFNIAGFWTDITNFQNTVFTGGPLGFITFNSPVRSRGFEIESAYQITPGFHVDGGLTYADASGVIQPIDPATGALEVDGTGAPILARYSQPQAPKLIFNVGSNYQGRLTDTLQWSIGAILRHRSKMYNQVQQEFPSAQLTTLDLSVGLKQVNQRWAVDLVAKNVTNAISQDFASPSVDPRFGAFYGAYLAGPNSLRTVMLSIRAKY